MLSIQAYDKDVVGRDFMGQLEIPLSDFCPDVSDTSDASVNHLIFDTAEPTWYLLGQNQIHSSVISGEIQLRIGWEKPATSVSEWKTNVLWQHLRSFKSMDEDDESVEDFDSLAFQHVMGQPKTEEEKVVLDPKAVVEPLRHPAVIAENIGLLSIEVVEANNLPRVRGLILST